MKAVTMTKKSDIRNFCDTVKELLKGHMKNEYIDNLISTAQNIPFYYFLGNVPQTEYPVKYRFQFKGDMLHIFLAYKGNKFNPVPACKASKEKKVWNPDDLTGGKGLYQLKSDLQEGLISKYQYHYYKGYNLHRYTVLITKESMDYATFSIPDATFPALKGRLKIDLLKNETYETLYDVLKNYAEDCGYMQHIYFPWKKETVSEPYFGTSIWITELCWNIADHAISREPVEYMLLVEDDELVIHFLRPKQMTMAYEEYLSKTYKQYLFEEGAFYTVRIALQEYTDGSCHSIRHISSLKEA